MKKKLKEIPFNHELIGQEGIVIKKRSGKNVECFISKYRLQNCKELSLCTIDEEGTFNAYNLSGKVTGNGESLADLIMYQEIEVKEPRVIWVNIYDHGSMYAYNREINAKNSFNSVGRKGKTIKFIEVIEEGE